jgi:hypothetical protein
MTCLRTAVIDRLNRLTAVLIDLKERVRAAVASELGKAVGDAVRDLVSAVVRHRLGAPLEREARTHHPHPGRRHPQHDPWDEDDGTESWDEDDESPRPVRPFDDSGAGTHPPLEPPASRWASAVTLGASVARWVVARRGPPWVGAVAGGLVLAGSLAGGPVLGAIAGVVHVAAELMPFAGLMTR